jgi:hypothetical protein
MALAGIMLQQAHQGLLQRVQAEQSQRGTAVAACPDHATVAHVFGKWRQELPPAVPGDGAPAPRPLSLPAPKDRQEHLPTASVG